MSDPAEQASPQSPSVPVPGPTAAQAAPWTPPGAPPFGTPVAQPSYAPPAGYPTPPGAAPQPGYAPPTGYAVPPYSAAPGYSPAVGYNAAASYATAAPAPGRALGRVALILALVAVVGSSLAGAVAGTSAGLVLGPDLVYAPLEYSADLSMYSPVRGWVLLGEIAFWVGTVLGTWALVQGIIAAVKRRGRGTGIAAIVVAAIGPVVFFTVTWGALAVGMATGATTGA